MRHKHYLKLVQYTLKRTNTEGPPQPDSTGHVPQRPVYETVSPKMSELAKTYRGRLQKEEPNIGSEERARIINETTARVKRKLDDQESEEIGSPITREEIQRALKQSDKNSAPGLDGISFELWKALATNHEKETRTHNREATESARVPGEIEEEKAMDLLGVLELLYKDICRYGKAANSEFADGWICPIYKKNDKADIDPLLC
jgi:hypothetical protein